MRIVWKILSTLLMIALWITQGHATEVKDSGILLGEYPNIYWMDDRFVIFEAASGEYCEKQGSYKQPLNRIAIFDTEAGVVRWHGDIGINGLCFAEGNISYARRRHTDGKCPQDEYQQLMGVLGQEAVIPLERKIGKISLHNCRPNSELPPMPEWMVEAKKQGRIFSRLRPEHGWLEWEKPQPADAYRNFSKYPVRLYRPGGNAEEGISIGDTLKIRMDKTTDIGWTTAYVSHKGAYVLRTGHFVSPLQAGAKATLWWLYPDGRIEEIVTYRRTEEDWPFANVEYVVPTKAGIFFGGGERTLTNRVGESGIYKMTSKAPQRVVAGRVTPMVLSPDGCKLAYGNDDRPLYEGVKHYKLQIVDVCKGERK